MCFQSHSIVSSLASEDIIVENLYKRQSKKDKRDQSSDTFYNILRDSTLFAATGSFLFFAFYPAVHIAGHRARHIKDNTDIITSLHIIYWTGYVAARYLLYAPDFSKGIEIARK